MASNFKAQVADWVHETEGLLEAIVKQSVQELAEEMQTTHFEGGHNRIDLGWHVASFQLALNGEAQDATRDAPQGKAPPYTGGEVALTIAGSSLGDTYTGSYGMAYSMRLEYGFSGTDAAGREYNQPAYMFVRLAAQNWQQIVERVQNSLKTG